MPYFYKMKRSRASQTPVHTGPSKQVPGSTPGFLQHPNVLPGGMLLIALLGVAIYSNSFECSFHFDDYFNFAGDTRFPELDDFSAWWQFSRTRLVAFYSFALNIHLHGLEPWGFHLVNLAIHILNALLVAWLCVKLFDAPGMKGHVLFPFRKEIALVAGLFFVAHPLATQSVTYLVQRMASMAAMFYLLSLGLYASARLANSSRHRRALFYGGAALAAALALHTKENAFTLPLAILLVELAFFRTGTTIPWNNKSVIPLALAGTALFIWLLIAVVPSGIFKTIPPSYEHPYMLTPLSYLYTQFSALLKYLQLLFIPVNQMLDYDFPVAKGLLEPRTLFSLMVLLALLGFALFWWRRYRLLSFGILWFFLTSSVESGIIPIYDVIYEHRSYLPSVGFFYTVTAGAYLLFRQKYPVYTLGAFACIIFSFSFLAYQRNMVWKDHLSLWSDNVAKAPGIVRPWYNLGFAYKELGKWEKAEEMYNRALRLSPEYTDALSERAIALEKLGRREEAVEVFSKLIAQRPEYPNVFLNRGVTLATLNRHEEAIRDFDESLRRDTSKLAAYLNRGISHAALDQSDEAISDYNEVLKLNPRNATALFKLGNVHYKRKEWEQAIARYNEALAVDPGNVQLLVNRGNIFGFLKRWDEALDSYSKAVALDPSNVMARHNRGLVYAQRGEWKMAVASYDEVLRLDPNYLPSKEKRAFALTQLNASQGADGFEK